MAYFDYVCDVMVTKLLELASELIAAKVISKKNDLLPPNAKDGQSAVGVGFTKENTVIAPPINGCWSIWRFICTTITQLYLTCKTIIKVTQKSVAHQTYVL